MQTKKRCMISFTKKQYQSYEELDQTTLNNPVTDIVDSYYISKVGYEEKILSH